jgi:hypothetical protein
MACQKFRMARHLDLIEIIRELFRIIFIGIILYVIYQVSRAIVGGTWETENIIIAGVGIMMAGLFVIVGFLINQAKAIGRLEIGLNNCFERVVKIENKNG